MRGKIKKVLEFILALLNFLFHFKSGDEEEVEWKKPVGEYSGGLFYLEFDRILFDAYSAAFSSVAGASAAGASTAAADFLRERLVLEAFLAGAFNMFSL